MSFPHELLQDSDRAWERFQRAVEGLTEEQLCRDGYYPDWCAKDLLAHLGCWAAEAAQELARMSAGTWEKPSLDEDAMNARFHREWRERDLEKVRSQLLSAQAHMLEELEHLPPEAAAEAEARVRLHWTEHLEEHLPRLGEWCSELRAQ